ncbi:hypothetical protein [Bosea sp. (in: a-proteobacteria)]|uniref:hypothetical protein n=1 Tax=Bosea sp. (in: a-proteobacteria) TaxID=1871050 RepID=UPI00260DF555|nr:hypothetical protein [Bosea sp. (in: a-proteobacteria)]MCO5092907.1 hypothetical protein [Bosea sp. (in: a-proteobacteria)]
MSRQGRLVGVAFAVFALICLVATYDYSRGRIPETRSALVSDVLSVSNGRECARDATEIVTRHIPLGTGRAEAENILAQVTIDPPKPWFWTPAVENSTVSEGTTIEALHTIKATAFGSNLLRIYLGFEDGKVKRVAAEVVCHFG